MEQNSNENFLSIEVGQEYLHVEGLRYKVTSLSYNATGYEKGVEPVPTIVYEQLDQGSFPPGTI